MSLDRPDQRNSQLPPRQNLREATADFLRNEIMTGRLRPGRRIDQDGVARELGISQLPVREALITLDGEGLVETIARRGAYVRRLAPDDITDHYEIYGHVAGIAAARATRKLSREQVDALRQVHEQMCAASDAAQQERLNFEFHRLINAAGGSQRLTSMLRLLARSLPVDYFQFVPGWAATACTEHQQILDAIQARRPTSAQRAMERHLADSAQHAVAMLEHMHFFDSDDTGKSDSPLSAE